MKLTVALLLVAIVSSQSSSLLQQSCVCNEIFRPVMYQGQSFDNLCKAQCKYPGITQQDVHTAQIQPPITTPQPTPIKAPAGNCACTRQYNPVTINGVQYSNPCMARCAGANIPSRPTPLPTPKPTPGRNCICTMEYRPVTYRGETFSNFCNAKCKYPKITQKDVNRPSIQPPKPTPTPRPTPKPNCICTMQYNPVTINGVRYSNPCMARCAGAKV